MKNLKTRISLFVATALLIFFYAGTKAQNHGIKFEEGQTWTQIKFKAMKEHKYIFMDVFATWCGPCKEMDKEIYPSEKVGNYMNDNFISVKVQIDRTKEDSGEVKSWYNDAAYLAKTYKVTGLPNFLFFSPEGKLVSRGIGYKDVDGFLNMAKESLNPDSQFYTLIEAYHDGKIDYDQMPDLVAKAKSLGETTEANEIAKDYIDNYLFQLKENDLFTKEHLNFIAANIGSKNSKAYELFFKNGSRIDKILYPDAAVYALKNFIASSFIPKAETWESQHPDWDAIEKTIIQEFGPLGKEVVYGKRMLYCFNIIHDLTNFGKYYTLYFKTALKRPDFNINDITWVLFENVSDPIVISFACNSVMKYAMDRWYVPEKNAYAYDTYANLLYRVGKVTEGLEWEKKALEMKRGAPDENLFVETLKKMREGKATWKTAQPANNY